MMGTLALATALHAVPWNAWVYGGNIVTWPDAACVRYLMPSSFPAGAAHTQQLVWSMGDWSSIDACAFQFYYAILDQDYPTDHFDGYSDTLAVDPGDLDPGVLAVTYSVNAGPQWYDMDMEYSDFPLGVGWNFGLNPTCEEEAIPGDTGFCFMLAALHECGHSIGLAHEPTGSEPAGDPWIVCTMNPAYAHGGSNGSARVFESHADDRLGARALYPAAASGEVDLATLNFSWSDQYVGVPFTVHVEPSEVDPGGAITIRCAIENRGSSDVPFVMQEIWISDDATLDTADVPMAQVPWSLPAGGLIDFDAGLDLPQDIAAGDWRAITVLDPANDVAELYEDNNDAIYCTTFTIRQLPPEIVTPLGQHFAVEGKRWTSPVPAVTLPINAAPLQWTLAGVPPTGLTIDSVTGQLTWENPVASQFQYMLFVKVTNGAGSDMEVLYLGVKEHPCAADLSGNGVVDGPDLSLLLGYWGGGNLLGDINGDGAVNGGDLAALLGSWGPC